MAPLAGTIGRNKTLEIEPIVMLAGEGDRVSFRPGETTVWKATAASTNGVLDVGEFFIEPQLSTAEHVHRGNDETLFVLDGLFRFKVGTQEVEVSSGGCIFVPRSTPHAWLSVGPAVGRLLVLITPGGMAGFFRELDEFNASVAAAGLTPATMGDEWYARIEAIQEKYQFERVGPGFRSDLPDRALRSPGPT